MYFAHNTIANPRTKPISKKNHPTLESTKEEVFNIGKERRIRRNKEKKDNEHNATLSRSVERRKKNYEHIYGSDIFNNRRATSTERRRGVKQIPNVTNTFKLKPLKHQVILLIIDKQKLLHGKTC